MTRVGEAVKALALCHNVTPVYEEGVNPALEQGDEIQTSHSVNYQAASPDEVRQDSARKDGGGEVLLIFFLSEARLW